MTDPRAAWLPDTEEAGIDHPASDDTIHGYRVDVWMDDDAVAAEQRRRASRPAAGFKARRRTVAAETPAARAARARQRWRVQMRDGRWEVIPPRDHWAHQPVHVWLYRAGSVVPADYRDTAEAAQRWSLNPEEFHGFVHTVLRASIAPLAPSARAIREDLFRGLLTYPRPRSGRRLVHPWGEADEPDPTAAKAEARSAAREAAGGPTPPGSPLVVDRFLDERRRWPGGYPC